MVTMYALTLLSLVLAAAPATKNPFRRPPCPDGSDWVVVVPPEGDEHYCATRRGDELVRHGWSVELFEDTRRVSVACEYKDGQLDGRCSHFDEGGRPTYRGFYRAGVRVHYQFFWDALRKTPADPLPDRRAEVEEYAAKIGASAADAGALAQHVLDHYDAPVEDIRDAVELCGPTFCASAGRVGDRNIIALEVEPRQEKVAATAAAFVVLRDRVAAEKAAAEKIAAAEREAAEKIAAAQRKAEEKAARLQAAKERKEQATWEKRWRRWAYTKVRCNDGSRSKSCVCGRGSFQGCCSYHGGVYGCPPEP